MRQQQVECGSLSATEIKSATMARWPGSGEVTSIAYTFDASVVSQQQRDWIYNNYGKQSQLSEASNSTRFWVKTILDAWKASCNALINFSYEPKPEADFRGIVIIQCDKMEKIAGFMRPTFNQSSGDFIKAQLCIPSNAGNSTEATLFSLRTLAHELGHALGFKHLHEIPSVAARLRQTTQGRACSVMPYLANITASEKNLCTTASNCLGSTFAVTPGPLDDQLCKIYRANSNKITMSTTTSSPSTVTSMLSTLLSTSSIVSEQLLYGFFSNLKQRDSKLLSPRSAKLATMLLTRGAMTSLGLLDPLTTLAFSALEVIALFCHDDAAQGVLLIRFALSIIVLLNLLYALFTDQNPALLMTGFVAISFIAYFSYHTSLQTGQWLADSVNQYTEAQPQSKSSSLLSFFRGEQNKPDLELGLNNNQARLKQTTQSPLCL